MMKVSETDLVRLLRDADVAESVAERELRREVEADPRLAARLTELRSVWNRLAEPELEPPGAGFAAAVLERLRAESIWNPWSSGALGRLAAAAALLAGVALGVGLGRESRVEADELFLGTPTLADVYFSALADPEAWSEADEGGS